MDAPTCERTARAERCRHACGRICLQGREAHLVRTEPERERGGGGGARRARPNSTIIDPDPDGGTSARARRPCARAAPTRTRTILIARLHLGRACLHRPPSCLAPTARARDLGARTLVPSAIELPSLLRPNVPGTPARACAAGAAVYEVKPGGRDRGSPAMRAAIFFGVRRAKVRSFTFTANSEPRRGTVRA